MISVIISTHNRAEKLDKAIQSVVDQTYKDWELIIVDDASNDSTQEMLYKKWIGFDKRIQ